MLILNPSTEYDTLIAPHLPSRPTGNRYTYESGLTFTAIGYELLSGSATIGIIQYISYVFMPASIIVECLNDMKTNGVLSCIISPNALGYLSPAIRYRLRREYGFFFPTGGLPYMSRSLEMWNL